VPIALGKVESRQSSITCKYAPRVVQAIRYVVVLVSGFIAGTRTVDAVRSWIEWHRWEARDPSGADGYRHFFIVDSAAALLSLALAGLVWWLLRPKSPQTAG
jgi:hypothetical protein